MFRLNTLYVSNNRHIHYRLAQGSVSYFIHVCTCLLWREIPPNDCSVLKQNSPHNETIKTTITDLPKNVDDVDTYNRANLCLLFVSFAVKHRLIRYRTCDNKNLSVSFNIYFKQRWSERNHLRANFKPLWMAASAAATNASVKNQNQNQVCCQVGLHTQGICLGVLVHEE